MIPKDNKSLEKLCREWQKRLLLSDWEISVSYMSGDVLKGAQGICEPFAKLRRAHIGILLPADYPPDAFPQDVEVSLVHELLHCYHHMARYGTVADLFEEQGVEAASRALVALKRRRK